VYNIYTRNEDITWGITEHPEKAFPPRLEATHKATGEALERRSDDHAFSVVKRIDTYNETTKPLIEHYRGQGVLVEIPADQPIDAVSDAIRTTIEKVQTT
jgi:adenylate kinase